MKTVMLWQRLLAADHVISPISYRASLLQAICFRKTLLTWNSCLVIFFSALAGVGYVDPDAALLSSASAFVPGAPVFHARADQADLARVSMLEDQKELETLWQRKKRPKDVSSQSNL